MLNNNVETQKKDIIEKYLVMANYYRRLSFFKKIKLKYFGDNLFYNKKNLLMDSIKKFYSQKYDNLINVVSNYESICDGCNTRIDHDKYNQFKNIVIPKIQNYKKEQLSLLWMDFPEVFGASSNFFVDHE